MNEPPSIVNSGAVVMVIDPEVLIRMTIAESLRSCGYVVIEGTSANDVWSVLEAQVHLDVVFAEVQLGGTEDGFELAKRLRQSYPDIDVIIPSGVQSAVERSKELCEERLLNKTPPFQNLPALIHQLLERRRNARGP